MAKRESNRKECLKDKNDCTLLWIAAQHGHLEIVKALIKAGAKVDLQDLNAFTPFHAAFQNGHFKVAEFLRGHETN